jgi:iron-sulfur cluster repair protein YtfE (RIC family)
LLNEFLEHDLIHERLTKLRELALRIRVRGTSFGELLDEVDVLMHAIYRHIHLENNVLIPRVIDLENRLKTLRQEPSTA